MKKTEKQKGMEQAKKAAIKERDEYYDAGIEETVAYIEELEKKEPTPMKLPNATYYEVDEWD
jgi:hypothetical protein